MPGSADLYAAASDLGRRAGEHDAAAEDLEAAARPLDGLLRPVVHWHNAETWTSSAATASRQVLVRQDVVTLGEVRAQLAEVVRLLRSQAEGLRSDQQLLRRQADATAADERRAAAAIPTDEPSARRPFVLDLGL